MTEELIAQLRDWPECKPAQDAIAEITRLTEALADSQRELSLAKIFAEGLITDLQAENRKLTEALAEARHERDKQKKIAGKFLGDNGKLILESSKIRSALTAAQETIVKMRKALEKIAVLRDDKCIDADAGILWLLLDNKVSIARAALASPTEKDEPLTEEELNKRAQKLADDFMKLDD